MKIDVADIRKSKLKVRAQMDPGKLAELTASLKEIGQVVPIKVRKLEGGGYELVYGHRRLAAAKASGALFLDAIVEDMDDDRLLMQSLAENVIREDMAAIDIAKALRLILDQTEVTQDVLAKRLGWSAGNVRNYLTMLEPEIRKVAEAQPVAVSMSQAMEARAGTGGDMKLAAQVLQRTAKDDLSKRETRQVAQVVKQAADFGGSKAVTRVLAQSTAAILRSADPAPDKAKPRDPEYPAHPFERKVSGKIAFQWMTDPRTILAEEGIRAISRLIHAINTSDEDRGGGKAVLRNLRRTIMVVVSQLDAALKRK